MRTVFVVILTSHPGVFWRVLLFLRARRYLSKKICLPFVLAVKQPAQKYWLKRNAQLLAQLCVQTSVRINKNYDLQNKWREKNQKNFSQEKWKLFCVCHLRDLYFRSMASKCGNLKHLLQKFFRFRPFFVSRAVQAKQKWLKWTIIQKS